MVTIYIKLNIFPTLILLDVTNSELNPNLPMIQYHDANDLIQYHIANDLRI